jgi:hypothetical protein
MLKSHQHNFSLRFLIKKWRLSYSNGWKNQSLWTLNWNVIYIKQRTSILDLPNDLIILFSSQKSSIYHFNPEKFWLLYLCRNLKFFLLLNILFVFSILWVKKNYQQKCHHIMRSNDELRKLQRELKKEREWY